ncbi:uncharacterized protein LOC18777644 isoform X2 [Prunus persica]|uniref:uncharacterized protein LOC18777644 isoform X2 n=1 Tax=Prunus persica TaxID=3760 RepID=UPI0009AB98AC|nr:uncharacterized protein LOC18777644 isoform X2 [Prunus persica]
MEGDSLSWDYLLVPVGLCVLGIYHIWLLITVQRNPTKTVMGLNSAVRKQWVFSMMDSTRYFAHASFLATLPTGKDKTDYIEYVSTTVNRGSYFWSLGLRAFYLSIPLFLWIFGAIPMFVCCCIMTIALIIQPPVLHNLFTANPSKRKGEPMMSNQLVNRRQILVLRTFSFGVPYLRIMTQFLPLMLLDSV